MKFSTIPELEAFFLTCPNPTRIQRVDGHVVAFSFEKKTSGHTHRLINVSLVKSRNPSTKKVVQCTDDVFFDIIDKNYERITNVKKTREKITAFKLDGIKYTATPPPGVGLFDLLPYKRFLRYTRSRFYGNDTILRNGYFPGLSGCSTANINQYKLDERSYDVYDIDINHAYPDLWRQPLPYGAFYTCDQWNVLEKKPHTYMNFYHIVLKNIKNEFNIFIPPVPFMEYRDFDFLAHKTEFELIVSEYRLHLIDMIYGDFVYELKEIYFCATKIYVGVNKWISEQMLIIDDMKNKGIDATDYKRAVNMLVGMFGKKDERVVENCIRKINNEYGDIFCVEQTKRINARSNNYLPLAMTIVDMCAVKLFYMLTCQDVLPLSWNTDGAVIAVKPWVDIENSKETGHIKSKIIKGLKFYESAYCYNRPIIVDSDNTVYNSKSISIDENNLIFEMVVHTNTAHGFNTFIYYIPIPREQWHGFNIRESELNLKVYNSWEYVAARKNPLLKEKVNAEYNRLAFPYDHGYIRHGLPVQKKYEFLFQKYYEID